MDPGLVELSSLIGEELKKQSINSLMKRVILTLALLVSLGITTTAGSNEELKLLGRVVIHENGSWVNPEEPKFKFTKPKTWFKRNYVRHYMQGSEELTSSIIHFEWKKFKQAAITGERVPMGEVLTVFKFKDTYKAIKTHPEAAIVPVGMLAGTAVEGSEGAIMFTVGVIKNIGEITLKTLKFVSKPVKKVIPIKRKMEVNDG
jgi:hypothetical protein